MAFGKEYKGQAISVQGLSKLIKLYIQICYDLAVITALEGLGDQFVRQIEASVGTTRHVHAFLNFSMQLSLVTCYFLNQIQVGCILGKRNVCHVFLSLVYFRIILNKSSKAGSQKQYKAILALEIEAGFMCHFDYILEVTSHFKNPHDFTG